MSTLNCPEEVYLAEKLIEINPWADMVRFARTGGEANSIAITNCQGCIRKRQCSNLWLSRLARLVFVS